MKTRPCEELAVTSIPYKMNTQKKKKKKKDAYLTETDFMSSHIERRCFRINVMVLQSCIANTLSLCTTHIQLIQPAVDCSGTISCQV